MRHRFHAICPYFAMFPEAFVKGHLAASPHRGVVFNPFCGRRTTVFQALLDGREAIGCDVNLVAAYISGAKAIHRIRSKLEHDSWSCEIALATMKKSSGKENMLNSFNSVSITKHCYKFSI